jgi:uncharacterized membrane protein
MLNNLGAHLRNKLLAGALTAGPIVLVVVGAVWLEEHTKVLTSLLGLPHFPGLGVVVALVAVYLLGVVVTSLIGGFMVRGMDYLLRRIPGLNLLYRTWKDVLLLPPGKTGVFNQVVLVPGRDSAGKQIGFTSGETLPGTPPRLSVFVPSLPNPLSGQLVLIPTEMCSRLAVTVEEAFKFLLSTGNYVPAGLLAEAAATSSHIIEPGCLPPPVAK